VTSGISLLKNVNGQKPREIAADVLGRRSKSRYTEELLNAALARVHLAPADRHLCQELVCGVVRWQQTIDWLIGRKTQNRSQKAPLQNLLRLGLYQIFWLDRIPSHAAVHETVEQAKQAGFGPQSGFVNAVLRGYLREFEVIRQMLKELKRSQPSLGYSHPQWLAERWEKRAGKDATSQLMGWNNTPPRTFARVNSLRVDAGKLLEQWRDENVEYDFVRKDWVSENLVFELKSHPALEQLPSFKQGFFYIQDPSTLLAVQALDPKPDETILDFCAAPGGKLSYIAELICNEGLIVAQDITPERLKLIEQNLSRLGISCVKTVGAEDHRPGSVERSLGGIGFNKILVDAPCSNTGVIRRRVDLRWRLQPEEIKRLGLIQQDLLAQAAGFLKAGGKLVYSTCSLEPEENQEVTGRFLEERADFRLEYERELRPFVDGVDGAYVAGLRKYG